MFAHEEIHTEEAKTIQMGQYLMGFHLGQVIFSVVMYIISCNPTIIICSWQDHLYNLWSLVQNVKMRTPLFKKQGRSFLFFHSPFLSTCHGVFSFSFKICHLTCSLKHEDGLTGRVDTNRPPQAPKTPPHGSAWCWAEKAAAVCWVKAEKVKSDRGWRPCFLWNVT